ncbi:sensor histidine kinase [Paenibacillus aurantius]|uniref:Sensor histidine kinase n=1 Tax=Paenibacillus aurantius TaxID=2918900 RepID=A0AA96LE58_9BACL|nr:sensor histidine kinase [Paenibacillus aurantius]WNQ10460.1 sensor histidine kinase [Paenibacillus aurantius]
MRRGKPTIKTRLLLLFFVFFLVPFSVSAAIWYGKSSKSLEDNAVDSTGLLVKQINHNLDFYFDDIEKATLPLLTNKLVQEFVKIDPQDQYQYFYTSNQLLAEVYPRYVYGRGDIYGFTVLSNRGVYYSSTSLADRIEQYRNVSADGPNYRILGISKVNDTPVLTVHRRIIDNLTYRPAGAIVIDLFLDRILEIIDEVRIGGTGFVYIVDENGRYLYHPDHELWGRPASVRPEGGSMITGKGHDRKMVISDRSSLTGLTLVAEIPRDMLMGKLNATRDMTVFVGGLLFLFALVTAAMLSLSITRPLSHLLKLMKKAEMGDLHVRAPVRQDEIGRLNQGFNHMLDEIGRLIDVAHRSQMREMEMAIKQREALLQSMQSRINPHFLYNTLSVINSHAIVSKVKPISQMTVWLSQILRYSLDVSEKPVPLEEELNHVLTYIKIQKARFKDLEVDVGLNPDWGVRVESLRLIIQPVVENAFAHGYEKHGRKPGYIGIWGEADSRWFTLRIADKGSGMEPDLLGRYRDALASFSEQDMLDTGRQPFERIGLWNVHCRLRLAFGPPYGVSIAASDTAGTIIELKLPYAPADERRGLRLV